MIDDIHIEKQVALSRQNKRTSQFLCDLTFTILKSSLLSHYGDNYSDRCVPASFGIIKILNELGIDASAHGNNACYVLVKNAQPIGWDGFVGIEPGHVWVRTEFAEIVDFTISQLHLHPLSKVHDAEPIPPIWWDIAAGVPGFFVHIDGGEILPEFDNTADLDDFNAFLECITIETEAFLESLDPSEVTFGPVLREINQLRDLAAAGTPWVVGAAIAHMIMYPYPQDVIHLVESGGIILPDKLKRPLDSINIEAELNSLQEESAQ